MNISEYYSRYHTALVSYLEGFDSIFAEDMAQETWIRAMDNRHRFHGGNFRSWLFRIGRGIAIDAIRHRKVRKHVCVNKEPSFPDIFDRIDLSVLTDRQQDILLLRLRGLEFKEISKIMGIPHGTVNPAYTAAIIKIRQDLLSRGVIQRTRLMGKDRRIFKDNKKT